MSDDGDGDEVVARLQAVPSRRERRFGQARDNVAAGNRQTRPCAGDTGDLEGFVEGYA